MSDDEKLLIEMYVNIGAPLALLTTCTGFMYSMFDEANTMIYNERPNSAITSFVNVVGMTFVGFCTGFCWPITMPCISCLAIYNKLFSRPKLKLKYRVD
jgi:hypothetical protein